LERGAMGDYDEDELSRTGLGIRRQGVVNNMSDRGIYSGYIVRLY
jgi:hypothetical protein